MDAIARKRAFVSRTAVYFYFANKRAVVDRLDPAAFPRSTRRRRRTSTASATRGASCAPALARVVAVVNSNAGRAPARRPQLSGAGERMPEGWRPYIMRFVERATARIARDQRRGIAPTDIAPRLSAPGAAGDGRGPHHPRVVIKRGDATESISSLAELWWRAVYSRPGQRSGLALARGASCRRRLRSERRAPRSSASGCVRRGRACARSATARPSVGAASGRAEARVRLGRARRRPARGRRRRRG